MISYQYYTRIHTADFVVMTAYSLVIKQPASLDLIRVQSFRSGLGGRIQEIILIS